MNTKQEAEVASKIKVTNVVRVSFVQWGRRYQRVQETEAYPCWYNNILRYKLQ